jgi:hypothetical protein
MMTPPIMSVVSLSLLLCLCLCLCISIFPTHVNGFTKSSQIQRHVVVNNNFSSKSTTSSSSSSLLVLTSTTNGITELIDGSAINGLSTSSSPLFSSSTTKNAQKQKKISKLSAMIGKIGMMAFIISMCLSLPIALFPPYLLHRLKLISQVQQQQRALTHGQFCARWLLRLIPFCNVQCCSSPELETNPQPCVWVCNHTSALDIFILLAKDKKLRGKNRRPIKIVYVSFFVLFFNFSFLFSSSGLFDEDDISILRTNTIVVLSLLS